MTDWPSISEDAALRGVAPPPLSADFTERTLARLEGRAAPLPPGRAPRDRRGVWARGRVILLSGAACGLLSVGAAASGLFGVSIRNVPVVGSWVEAVAPAKPKPALAKVPKPHAPSGAASRPAPVALPEVLLPETAPAPLPPLPVEVRREAAAERMAQALDRRDQRRRELGLPPKPRQMSPEMRERLMAMPPEERRALVRRIRDLRAEAAAARGEMPPPPPRLQPRELTPEQRERLKEWRERRRAMREQSGLAEASPPLPPDESVPKPPDVDPPQ